VWYTGLGAPDLLRRSCASLSTKLTLLCDGLRVPVPEDAQGLVVINIGCHMVRVGWWGAELHHSIGGNEGVLPRCSLH
jgi:hypothetical protein